MAKKKWADQDPDYEQFTEKTIEVKQMLASFIRKLKADR